MFCTIARERKRREIGQRYSFEVFVVEKFDENPEQQLFAQQTKALADFVAPN